MMNAVQSVSPYDEKKVASVKPRREPLFCAIKNGVMGVVGLMSGMLFAGQAYQVETHRYGTYDRNDPSTATIVPKTSTLAFPGITVQCIQDGKFDVYGIFAGSGADRRGAEVPGQFLQFCDKNGDGASDYAVVGMTLCDKTADATDYKYVKCVVVELADGEGGVWAKALTARYVDYDKYAPQKQFATLSANGAVTYVGTGNDSLLAGGYAEKYYAVGALTLTKLVPTDAPMLAFEGITLEDLRGYGFTGRAGGFAISPSAKGTLANGYNTRVIETDGVATKIITELQVVEDQYVKCAVVELTDGEGGVYMKNLAGRYTTVSAGGLGFRFVNDDLTYAGSSAAAAGSFVVSGYGMYELTAVPPPESVYLVLDRSKTWSELVAGVALGNRETQLTVEVTTENAVLTLDRNLDRSKIAFVAGVGLPSDAVAAVVPEDGVSCNFDALDVAANLKVGLTLAEGISVRSEVMLNEGSKLQLAGVGTLEATLHGMGGVEVVGGTVTLSAADSDYVGGTLVKAGATLKSGTGCTVPMGVIIGPFGAATDANRILVEDGGHVDFAGEAGLNYFFDFGTDDALLNSGTKFTQVSSQLQGIRLTDDVTLGAENRYSLVTRDYLRAGAIDLNGHSLVKTGSDAFYIWSAGVTIAGSDESVFRVAEGSLNVGAGIVDGSATVELGEGTELTLSSGGVSCKLRADGAATVRKITADEAKVSFDTANTGLVCQVEAGTLRTVGNILRSAGAVYAFNEAGETQRNISINVANGATFDFNGYGDLNAAVTIAGRGDVANNAQFPGALMNSRSEMGTMKSQMTQLTLADDATIGGTTTFGLLAPNYGLTRLELGGHTLTVAKADDILLVNTDVRGTGTIAVEGGCLNYNREIPVALSAEYGVTIGAKGMLLVGDGLELTLARLENNGVIGASTGSIKVTDTVTAGFGAVPRLTLADGATIRITDVNRPLTVTESYSAAGTITIDCEGMVTEKTANKPLLVLPAGAATGTAVYRAINVPAKFSVRIRHGIPTMSPLKGLVVYVK